MKQTIAFLAYTLAKPTRLTPNLNVLFRSQTDAQMVAQRQRAIAWVSCVFDKIKHSGPMSDALLWLILFQPPYSPSHAITHTSHESVMKKRGISESPSHSDYNSRKRSLNYNKDVGLFLAYVNTGQFTKYFSNTWGVYLIF